MMGMPEKTFKKAKLVTQNKLWQILNFHMSIQIICTSQFKTTLPPQGIPQAFDWSFVPYSGEFDPKCARRYPSQAFDFHAKTLVSIASKRIFFILVVFSRIFTFE